MTTAEIKELLGRVEFSAETPIGFIEVGVASKPPAGYPEDTPDSIYREATIVYVGDHASAKHGVVPVREKHIDRVVEYHNSRMQKVKRFVSGPVPVHLLPPIQLDHSKKSIHTIGRLVGEVWKGSHQKILSDGSFVPALKGVMNILGRRNVTACKDGRMASISGGIDFDIGKIWEITIAPFAAAEEASLLNGTTGEEATVKEFILKFLTRVKKLSAKDAETKFESMTDEEKKSLEAEAKKIDDDEAEEKRKKELAGDTTDDGTSQSGETDEQKEARLKKEKEDAEAEKAKELAAATEAERVRQLAAAPPAGAIQLTANVASQVKELCAELRVKSFPAAELSVRRSLIAIRLDAIRRDGRITPVEYGKIDLSRLASSKQETVEAVLKSYEDREPAILAGMYGSVKAANLSEMAALVEMANKKDLEAEVRGDMSSTRTGGAELEGGAAASVAGAGASHDSGIAQLARALDSNQRKVLELVGAGQYKEAIKELAGLAGLQAEEVGPSTSAVELTALASSLSQVQNGFDRLVKLLGPDVVAAQ